MKPKIIRIEITREEGDFLFATSPDLPEFYLSDTEEEAILKDIPAVIEALFAAKGIKVKVIESEETDEPGLPPWIALPVDKAELPVSDSDHP